MSSPVSNTVRSATVKGVIRLSRMKPFTPPQTSHKNATSAHQKTLRRRKNAGTSVTSTINTLTSIARGSWERKFQKPVRPSVKLL